MPVQVALSPAVLEFTVHVAEGGDVSLAITELGLTERLHVGVTTGAATVSGTELVVQTVAPALLVRTTVRTCLPTVEVGYE